MYTVNILYKENDTYFPPTAGWNQHLQQAAMFPVCAIFVQPVLSQPGVTALGNVDTAIELWRLILPRAVNSSVLCVGLIVATKTF